MLKKVRVDQLRIGMALHELCGSWLAHPFWSKRFVLRTEGELAKLRASGIEECWIDTDKGIDPDAAPSQPSQPAATAPAPSPAVAVTVTAAPPAAPVAPAGLAPRARHAEPATSIEEESLRAAALLRRSKETVEGLFHEARMGRALDVESCLPLVDDIVASVSRNGGALTSLARLKTHDNYSFLHSVAVCALMVSLARKLGMDEAACRDAGLAGLLHDVGKAVLPLAILNKPGALDDAEFAIVKTHPERGRELLLQSRDVPATTIDVCLHHHERPDGKGYPERLSGSALSRIARMGAVCDVYDAITSNRPYKAGWDPAESIARMSAWSRTGQFDPGIFQAFVDCMGIYPIGALVRLQSGRLAVVIEQNPNSAMAPRVRVFFSTRSQLPVPTEVVDLARHGCVDRITGRESNERWKFPHLNELMTDPEPLRKVAAAGRH